MQHSFMTRRTLIRTAGALTCSTGLRASPLLASPTLAKPSGEVLLEIDGDIAAHNDAGRALLDRAMLEALPQKNVKTTTIWTKGVLDFSGPPLQVVLDLVGAGPGAIEAAALNDYIVTVPRNLLEAEVPIIAHRIDGRPFPVSEKGPLWIVFPYDADPKYRQEMVFNVSIWQLSTLRLLNA